MLNLFCVVLFPRMDQRRHIRQLLPLVIYHSYLHATTGFLLIIDPRLDRGNGKSLSLPECSRDKLNSERIMLV